MIEALYQKIKIREQTLSAGSLLRLRFCSIGILVLAPVFTGVELLSLWSIEGPLRWGIIITFMACLLTVALSRIANMLIFSDKHLDEWEIRLKKRSEAFGYRCFVFTLAPAFIILSVVQNDLNLRNIEFSFEQVMFVILNLYIAMIALPIIYAAFSQKPLENGEDVEGLSDWVI